MLDLVKEKGHFVFSARGKCLYTGNMNCLDGNAAMPDIKALFILVENISESPEEVGRIILWRNIRLCLFEEYVVLLHGIPLEIINHISGKD